MYMYLSIYICKKDLVSAPALGSPHVRAEPSASTERTPGGSSRQTQAADYDRTLDPWPTVKMQGQHIYVHICIPHVYMNVDLSIETQIYMYI